MRECGFLSVQYASGSPPERLPNQSLSARPLVRLPWPSPNSLSLFLSLRRSSSVSDRTALTPYSTNTLPSRASGPPTPKTRRFVPGDLMPRSRSDSIAPPGHRPANDLGHLLLHEPKPVPHAQAQPNDLVFRKRTAVGNGPSKGVQVS